MCTKRAKCKEITKENCEKEKGEPEKIENKLNKLPKILLAFRGRIQYNANKRLLHFREKQQTNLGYRQFAKWPRRCQGNGARMKMPNKYAKKIKKMLKMKTGWFIMITSLGALHRTRGCDGLPDMIRT